MDYISERSVSHISMVFDLVSNYYQLLAVTNVWACVPHVCSVCTWKTSINTHTRWYFNFFLSSPLLVVRDWETVLECLQTIFFCYLAPLALSECSRNFSRALKRELLSCTEGEPHGHHTTWRVDRQDHDRGSSPPVDPVPPGMDASVQRIKEMKILQPQGEDDFYGNTRAENLTRVVKVTPATEVILLWIPHERRLGR